MTIQFTKMQAGGNDFIVIDDASGRLHGAGTALAKRLCHRRFGIGADGLLLLGRTPATGRFRLTFVNPDGLVGEMCGNGVRCLAAFICRAGLAERDILLDTDAGEVVARYDNAATISVEVPAPVWRRRQLRVDGPGIAWTVDELDVGPPHVVCLVEDTGELDGIDVVTTGRLIREHPLFAPRGCNVNFVAPAGPDALSMRTYERGVEDETLCCGTGAIASAMVARERLGLSVKVTVACRGADRLLIDLSDPSHPRLIGGAHFIAAGEVDDSLLDESLAALQ